MALWGGRFKDVPDLEFKKFNDSLIFDYKLAEQDLTSSIAWAGALHEIGILEHQEYHEIVKALAELIVEANDNEDKIKFNSSEDIHSYIEQRLIEKVGDIGKKLHTGRSRNDQVATDFKLWCKQASQSILASLKDLKKDFVCLAKKELGTVIPGYTHLQRAQPILFSHWCMAYYEMINRDELRLEDAIKRLDYCPLGSGALAGTAYPIDRESLAHHLGFSGATSNSLDSVSDRDYVVELLSCASLSMIHLSRFAEDLIFYNSGEAGFIELDDSFSSGSSLMPQKKNPDALELIRGKTGRVFGSQIALMTTLKSLPLAYNKDLQEDKEGLFDAFPTWLASIKMASNCIKTLKVNSFQMKKAAMGGYSNATEVADYLVKKGIPFRDGHHIVGQLVQYALKQNKSLEDLNINEFKSICNLIEQDVYECLTIEACINNRMALGGTATEQVKFAIKQAEKKTLFEVRDARLDDVEGIYQLIEYWALVGENLPRSKKDMIHSINEFVVSEQNNKITGCASLYIYDTGLAEIRSVGTSLDNTHKGQGSALIKHILIRAKKLALKRVIVLTRVPVFFEKQGFTYCDKSSLPEKIIKDCDLCIRKNNCDEVAMEMYLHSKNEKVIYQTSS